MSVFLTVLVIVAVVAFLLLLSVGIFIALGVFLVVGGIALIIGLIFGGPNFFNISSTFDNSDALKVPQAFHDCLLKEEPETCRETFTVWEKKDLDLVVQLANQAKKELGKRDGDQSHVSQIQSSNINGDRTISLQAETDFELRKKVKESYVIISVDNDDKHPLKIKELKWDY